MIEQIQEALDKADKYESKLDSRILTLHGLSGTKGRHLLNNLGHLCSQHLEVGTYMGTTLLSAEFKNHGKFCGLDNFSQFGGHTELMNNLVGSKAEFIDADWNTITLEELPKNIDFFFYDGGHSYEDHYSALLKIWPNLTDKFIFMVDDWNGKEAKDGTLNSIDNVSCKVIHRWDIADHVDSDSIGYWNGFGIFLMEKV
jgi:hypothetical protein